MENDKNQRSHENRHQDPAGSRSFVSSGFGDAMLRSLSALVLIIGTCMLLSGCGFLLSTLLNAAPAESVRSAAEASVSAAAQAGTGPAAAEQGMLDPAVSDPASSATPAASPETTAAPSSAGAADPEQLAAAPEMSGTSKDFQGGSVIYKAADGNAYGMETGAFVGEYNPNVFVNGDKTGCVFFVPTAAEKILNDQLGQIPEDAWKLKILVPVQGNQNANSRIDISFLEDSDDHTYIAMNSADDLDVYNICPDSELFSRTPIAMNGTNLVIVSNLSRALRFYPDPTKMLNENAMYFVKTAVASNDNFCSDDLFNASFGDVFTQSGGNEVSIWLADVDSTYSLTLDNLAKTDDGILIGITSARD